MKLKSAGLLLLCMLLFSGTLTLQAARGANSFVVIPPGTGTNPSSPGYSPDSITVVIGFNNTVVWLNNDTVHHTVTPSTLPPGGNWSVGSGDLAPGKTYQFTFTVPGRYTYACAYHSFMHGTVIVKAASTVPEFPLGALAAVLLFAVATAALVVKRFGFSPKPPKR